MIQTMTRLFMNGHNLNTNLQMQTRISYPNQVAVVFLKLNSQMVQSKKLLDHGIHYLSISYLLMLIGVMLMAVTICHGQRINIFLVIVDHAGHKAQQVHLQTGLTFLMI